MLGGIVYKILYAIVRAAMFLYHPVFRVIGRENIPAGGGYLICPNHSGMADPVWVVFGLKLDHIPRIMAKKEAMNIPVLGWIIKKLGAFGVDREGVDVNAVKLGLRCLREEQQLMVFPEGTRVKSGKTVIPKRGAIVLAQRTDSLILPVYLTPNRRPFGPVTCVFGQPYKPEFSSRRPSDEEMETATQDLMQRIYKLGETV